LSPATEQFQDSIVPDLFGQRLRSGCLMPRPGLLGQHVWTCIVTKAILKSTKQLHSLSGLRVQLCVTAAKFLQVGFDALRESLVVRIQDHVQADFFF
jgi:hypothetical protein